MARPQKITDKQLMAYVDTYLDECHKKDLVPILAEYCLKVGISTSRLNERIHLSEELSNSIKRITDEKQVYLERGALLGTVNPTMAIFSLKQLGWRDKVEQEITTDQTIKVEMGDMEEYAD